MGESNRNPGLPLFEKIVDILYVIKRIIEMEGKFRGFAKLVAHFLCKLVAYGLGIRTADTDTRIPWVLAVCNRRISLSSF